MKFTNRGNKGEKARTTIGTFVGNFKEDMVNISVRVPKSYKEKIMNMKNPSEFLRNAVKKAVDKIEQKT